MKNLIKFGFAAMIVSLSFAACDSNKGSSSDADSTVTDSASVDTAVVVDADSLGADSNAIVDSLKK